MTKNLKTIATIAMLAVALGACGEPETVPDASEQAAPATADLLGSYDRDRPLPAEQVFFPDVFAEPDGSITLGFRMLPGYYIYKDKITIRSLTDGVEIGAPALPEGDIIVDEWFGEQEIYMNDVMANAPIIVTASPPASVDVEVTYQGCKKDELCYSPVSKIVAVKLATRLKFDAN